MAKCLGPLHSSEARGKVGGLVYNSWRGFATVKAKHAPAQPRTHLQLAVRAIAILISRAWAACAYKDDWNYYATQHPLTDWTNSPKRLTGANWFLMVTTHLMRLGLPQVDPPPEVPAPAAPTGMTAVGGSGTLTIDWATPSTHTDSVEIWLHGPHSAGRLASLISARYNCAPWGDEGGLALSGLAAGTYDAYIRVVSRTNGLASPFVSAQGTVT